MYKEMQNQMNTATAFSPTAENYRRTNQQQ